MSVAANPAKKVVIDFDDLICPTTLAKLSWCGANIDRINFAHLTDPGFASTFFLGQPEDEFYNSRRPTMLVEGRMLGGGFITQPPHPTFIALLEAIVAAGQYEIVVMTSGYDWVRQLKEEYCRIHLPDLITGFAYIGGPDEPTSKAEACQIWGACLIMEDRADYALECAQAGIPAVLFNALRAGWGHTAHQHRLLYPVQSWTELSALIRRMLAL